MRPSIKVKFPLTPTVTTFFLVLFLVGLGSWQLLRLQWKTELLSQIQSNRTLPVVEMSRVLAQIQPEKWEYRRVHIKGKFLHAFEVNLVPRALNGQPGSHLITPFQLESGGVILVNRGWVGKGPVQENIDRPEEEVELMGTIATFQKAGFFTPENNFEKKEIFNVDPNDFAKHNELVTLLPFYIIAEPDPSLSSEKWPQPVGMTLNIPNNHLIYALIWYGLAFSLSVIYCIFVYQWNHRLNQLRKNKN